MSPIFKSALSFFKSKASRATIKEPDVTFAHSDLKCHDIEALFIADMAKAFRDVANHQGVQFNASFVQLDKETIGAFVPSAQLSKNHNVSNDTACFIEVHPSHLSQPPHSYGVVGSYKRPGSAFTVSDETTDELVALCLAFNETDKSGNRMEALATARDDVIAASPERIRCSSGGVPVTPGNQLTRHCPRKASYSPSDGPSTPSSVFSAFGSTTYTPITTPASSVYDCPSSKISSPFPEDTSQDYTPMVPFEESVAVLQGEYIRPLSCCSTNGSLTDTASFVSGRSTDNICLARDSLVLYGIATNDVSFQPSSAEFSDSTEPDKSGEVSTTSTTSEELIWVEVINVQPRLISRWSGHSFDSSDQIPSQLEAMYDKLCQKTSIASRSVKTFVQKSFIRKSPGLTAAESFALRHGISYPDNELSEKLDFQIGLSRPPISFIYSSATPSQRPSKNKKSRTEADKLRAAINSNPYVIWKRFASSIQSASKPR